MFVKKLLWQLNNDILTILSSDRSPKPKNMSAMLAEGKCGQMGYGSQRLNVFGLQRVVNFLNFSYKQGTLTFT